MTAVPCPWTEVEDELPAAAGAARELKATVERGSDTSSKSARRAWRFVTSRSTALHTPCLKSDAAHGGR